MKKIILYGITAMLAVINFNSCLFKDDIGAELLSGTNVGDGVVHSGSADNINYHINITEAGFNSAMEKMDNVGLIGQLISAQYAMRGGKEGDPPAAHAYQYQFNLETDNYAGYFCAPQNFGGRLASTYFNSEDFNGGVMGGFTLVKNLLVPVFNHPQIDSVPEIKAIALLMYNYSAQEAVDTYGALPYVDYKKNKESAPFTYNSAEVIYKTIVDNIDSIVACFDNYETRPTWYKGRIDEILGENDKISGSHKIASWKRFANSHKLRMAMNIVKKDPELAKKWAEEAIYSGVIETPEQQFGLKPAELGIAHPLKKISEEWHDTRLNASLETLLKAYNHPALEFLFQKNSAPIISKDGKKVVNKDSMYVGLRSGIAMLTGQSADVNFRCGYSRLSDAIQEMPLFVMKISEVDFLRAEGALRGWDMGGTASFFYERGIENAYKHSRLKQYDANTDTEKIFDTDVYSKILSDYKGIEKAKEIEYIDPYDEENNAKSLITVGVKWNNGDNDETKLEKIITQKYIAGFPYSYGAWADLRRTGYPRIFPILPGDKGDGSLLPGDIIRRIPFTAKDEVTKKDVQTSGLQALGGPDLQGTRIWWDVPGANF